MAPATTVRRWWIALLVAALTLAGCATTESDSGAPSPVGSTPSSSSPSSSSPGGSTPSDASGSSSEYVHLGDSYAAGSGVDPVVVDSPVFCQRSAANFGHVVAARRHLQLTDVSCAGATTDDLANDQYFGVGPQLDALGSRTRLVTMTLGGNNDAVFGGAISKCGDVAGDGTGSPCRDRYGDALTRPIAESVYPALVTALRQVRGRAPNARVLIVGYPWILPSAGGCFPQMRVAAGDVAYLRALQATLNSAVRRAAQATGVTFVDMSRVSDGHDACAGSARWIEPQLGTTARITVHPNATGQRAMADQVIAALDR